MMDRLGGADERKARDVTEELKMQDQMAWVGRMNNIPGLCGRRLY